METRIHPSSRRGTSATYISATRIGALLVVGLSVISGSLATAAPSEADRAAYMVGTRQSAFHLMGFYMGPMGAMARGKAPMNAEMVANNAARIAALAPMVSEAFRLDTRAYDVETAALDSIWDNVEDFTAKAGATAEKATALATLAASGETDGLRPAIGALGKTCGSCHDDYKQDD
ncbi:MAG: cytochrome c [Pseudomonadota bacterium]